jgi:acyl-coenzyme A thioesterase PaaI-like protein
MIGEARIVNKGKKLVLADMEVRKEDGKLIAKGLATYAILTPPKTREE